jgi:16S rRNA G527 N7-methylase RsmG
VQKSKVILDSLAKKWCFTQVLIGCLKMPNASPVNGKIGYCKLRATLNRKES